LNLTQMATSNAITCTVASGLPTPEMALIECDLGDAAGEVSGAARAHAATGDQ
jgi:hypothetical protein